MVREIEKRSRRRGLVKLTMREIGVSRRDPSLQFYARFPELSIRARNELLDTRLRRDSDGNQPIRL